MDLSPLNKHCKRETFASESPFRTAKRIPKGIWKTVTDAWNGFLGMVLEEADRALTTFITPYSRWRYIYVLHEVLYHQVMVITDVWKKSSLMLRTRKGKVDDICHHDIELEEH